MKDFGRWFAEQALPALAEPVLEGEALERALDDMDCSLRGDREVWKRCCCCNEPFELTQYRSVAEIIADGVADEYCGRSQRCCP